MKSLIGRVRRSKRLTAAAGAAAIATLAAAALVLAVPPWAGLALAALALAALATAAIVGIRVLLRLHRDRIAETLISDDFAPQVGGGTSARRIAKAHEALVGGFPESALEIAKEITADAGVPVDRRIDLMRTVLDWYRDDERARREGPRRSRLDVVVVSHFGLPGGNTSAITADIQAFLELGLRVGLVHHPVFDWRIDAPVSERVLRLVDGERVRLLGPHDEVECDLALVRLPTVLAKPLESRPTVHARSTVVIANQTPFRFYGPEGPREQAWDIAAVEAGLTAWLGPHTWYAGGPAVQRILERHHADAFAGLDLAAKPWNECIDAAQWRRGEPRVRDGRIRIGRHSRDHRVKWPEDAATLRQSYPEADGFEIHVLGGADTPRRLLGRLPSNWTVHQFGAVSSSEFLAGIDVFSYYIASDGAEAFGRAPLEAMAAGVPVVMDPVFQPTFGDAALYRDPADVEFTARKLMDDPEWYASRQRAAWAFVEKHCSPQALAKRLSRHGVGVEVVEPQGQPSS
ncbi:glycosyltransferase [Glycomyces niveus]|uniref:Glycosyltransferase n=1 Tax=Glycomyces niveus TaxID=2820287 RepID=A0ABS3U946_9ACTN|nr:glycosyltransferase [Glycomyces sp. NEAU-S30]MBO3735263.1 glycosyltransferase [Glycomyces sp. NEAU-S30]